MLYGCYMAAGVGRGNISILKNYVIKRKQRVFPDVLRKYMQSLAQPPSVARWQVPHDGPKDAGLRLIVDDPTKMDGESSSAEGEGFEPMVSDEDVVQQSSIS